MFLNDSKLLIYAIPARGQASDSTAPVKTIGGRLKSSMYVPSDKEFRHIVNAVSL